MTQTLAEVVEGIRAGRAAAVEDVAGVSLAGPDRRRVWALVLAFYCEAPARHSVQFEGGATRWSQN